MPRLARLDAPGVLHHVMIRGIEKRRIFLGDADSQDFVERLTGLIPEMQTVCYAWALMSNHAHLLLRSGPQGLAGLMRRLLTGYAVGFNRRHRRHGQLFQNRYKSIICEEDAFFKELVCYIHLNPLRAGLVPDLVALEDYPFCGHGKLMGKQTCLFQDDRYVLNVLGDTVENARGNYSERMQSGLRRGRRPELVGGGLIRSTGGWSEVKRLRMQGMDRIKSDQRILGGSDFVQEILQQADDVYERSYALKRSGINLETVAERAAGIMQVDPSEIFIRSRVKRRADARALYCFWAVRELGISLSALADKLTLTPAAVSYAVHRGERLAGEKGYALIESC